MPITSVYTVFIGITHSIAPTSVKELIVRLHPDQHMLLPVNVVQDYGVIAGFGLLECFPRCTELRDHVPDRKHCSVADACRYIASEYRASLPVRLTDQRRARTASLPRTARRNPQALPKPPHHHEPGNYVRQVPSFPIDVLEDPQAEISVLQGHVRGNSSGVFAFNRSA
jgi:hypothetical protein